MLILLYLVGLIIISLVLRFLVRSKYIKKVRVYLPIYILLVIFIVVFFNSIASFFAVKLIFKKYLVGIYYYTIQYFFCLFINISIMYLINRTIDKYHKHKQQLIIENKDELNIYINSIKSTNFYIDNDSAIKDLIDKIIFEFKTIIDNNISFKVIAVGYFKSINKLINIVNKDENKNNKNLLDNLEKSLNNIIDTVNKIKLDIYTEKVTEFNSELDNLASITCIFKD